MLRRRLLLCAAFAAIPLAITALPASRAASAHGAASTHVPLASREEAASGPAFARSAESLRTFERAFPATVPPDGFIDGVRQAGTVSSAPVASWQELGPSYVPAGSSPNPRTRARLGISGRITALAVDPRTCTGISCATLYVGAAEGGLWRSTDSGQTWTPLLDGQNVQRIWAIALDPVNPSIIYVGTGDASMGNGAQAGYGVLRSSDGGATWQSLGVDTFGGNAINDLAIDPRTAGGNATTLYAGVTAARTGSSTTYVGSFYADPTPPGLGVYVSHDSGQTWININPAAARHAEVGSLRLDPSNPSVLDVSLDGKGIYQTSDGGKTWVFLTKNVLKGKHFALVRMAIAPSDPHVLYAAFEVYTRTTDRERIFRSADGGLSWQQLGKTPNACGSQCWDNMLLTVDPSSPDIVYAGGTANYAYLFGGRYRNTCSLFRPLPSVCNATIMKSTDGGRTWADITENGNNGPIHVDDHVILVDPNNPRVIYAGTDGGLFSSADGGATWTDLNRGLATFETQSIAADSAGNLYTGTQDNGTLLYRRSTGSWTHILDGDGGQTAVDPTQPSVSYSEQYGASLQRNAQNGAPYHVTYVDPFYGDYDKQGRGNFFEPFTLAPSNPRDIFFGTYRIWRSESRGGTDGNHDGVAFDDHTDHNDWVPISFDLSCSSVPKNLKKDCHYPISTVTVSPDNPNVVVAATDNGELWITSDALAKVRTDVSCAPYHYKDFTAHCNFLSGVHWRHITSGLPRRVPTSIAFFPHSVSKFLVSFSGYDQNTPKHPGHIFLTTDAGKTWKPLTGTAAGARLPDLPFADVLVNPANSRIYAAADYGLFVSADGGTTWTRFDHSLPSASVYEMVLTAGGTRLDVATFGRGIWEIAAP